MGKKVIEDTVEQAVLDWLMELGYKINRGLVHAGIP